MEKEKKYEAGLLKLGGQELHDDMRELINALASLTWAFFRHRNSPFRGRDTRTRRPTERASISGS